MEWKLTDKDELVVNMEYKHGVLFAQTVSRMRYLKEAQLSEVHSLVSGMWDSKRQAAREAKQKEANSYKASPSESDLY